MYTVFRKKLLNILFFLNIVKKHIVWFGGVTIGCRTYDRENVDSTPGQVVTTEIGDRRQTGNKTV